MRQTLAVMLVLIGLTCVAQANFTISSGTLTIQSNHNSGNASGTSTVNINSTGNVITLQASGNALINVFGGTVGTFTLSDTASVVSTSGNFTSLSLAGNAIADLTGGSVQSALAGQDSVIEFDNNPVGSLTINPTATAYFHVDSYALGSGLTISMGRVMGDGILSGTWNGGVPFQTTIDQDDFNASYVFVPEPSLALLTIASLLVVRRR